MSEHESHPRSRPTRRTVGLGAGALFASAAAARAQGGAVVPADDARLQYEGRTAVTAPGVVAAGFPGVVLRLDARATRIALRCEASDENAFIDVIVDGGAPVTVRLKKGPQTIPLVSGPLARRRIEIVRRTAPWLSVMHVTGVEVEGGSLAAPAPLPPKRLLFVGDSITCGSNADWPDLSAPEGPQHENARISYGAELARRLGAQRHLVAYGGRGVIRDWQGGRTLVTAPQFYDRALPDDPSSRWDASSYVPHAIGVCLGTNDFNSGIPEQYEFVNAYAQFIAKIRRDAPQATIFVIDSPMTADDAEHGPRRTVQRAYFDEVVAMAGSPRVRRGPVSHYPGRPGVDAHPIAAQHQAMATELEPLFREALSA